MNNREAFEKHFKECCLPAEFDGFDAQDKTAWKDVMFTVWQASRAQTIDECLRLHESIQVDSWFDAIIESREAYQSALKQLRSKTNE